MNSLLEQLKNNPSIISTISNDDINDEVISILIKSGYVISYDLFKEKPNLRNRDLLFRTFEDDNRIIAFFGEDDTKSNAIMAYCHNYVPTEFDLKTNIYLRNNFYIMMAAIKSDPELIKYTLKDVYYTPMLIKDCFEKYIISEEDLKKFPELCKNDSIMMALDKIDPKFKLYHISDAKRVELISDLLDKDQTKILDYPFVKQISKDKLVQVLNYLYLPIDEKNMDEEQKYFYLLDKVIDACIDIRYEKEKENFLFDSIATIGTRVMKYINLPSGKKSLATEFYNFINCDKYESVEYSVVKEFVNGIFDYYDEHQTLFADEITNIYNHILNLQANVYKTKVKNEIKAEIAKKLDLTAKKNDKVILDKKIRYVSELLKLGKLEYLNITSVDLHELVIKEREYIRNIKKIRQKKYSISDDKFLLLEEKVYNDSLTINDVKYILDINDESVIESIFKRYNRIKKVISDGIVNDNRFVVEVKDKEKFGFNYNNFVIANNDNIKKTIGALVLNMDYEKADKILSEKDGSINILSFIPLVGLIDEFSAATIGNLLINYSKIIEGLRRESSFDTYESNPLLFIGKNLNYLIKLSNSLSKTYSFNEELLGEDIVKRLKPDLIDDYVNIYVKMLVKEKSLIPPLDDEFEKYKFKSGDSSASRLLIGRDFGNSCIDLDNYAGKVTFKKCLTEEDGDVLLVRNKYDNSVVARSLLFRKGNMILLTPFYDVKGNTFDDAYNSEFLNKIGSSIIESSKENGDNIDYVLLGLFGNEGNDLEYQDLKSSNFFLLFPHADLTDKALVIGSKNNDRVLLSNLKFEENPKSAYNIGTKINENNYQDVDLLSKEKVLSRGIKNGI